MALRGGLTPESYRRGPLTGISAVGQERPGSALLPLSGVVV
jgi:hypothetical protein